MATGFNDVACTRCGCVCDDLSITVEHGRIVDAAGACALAEHGYLDQAASRVDEVPMPLESILPATYATDDEVLGAVLTVIKEEFSVQARDCHSFDATVTGRS